MGGERGGERGEGGVERGVEKEVREGRSNYLFNLFSFLLSGPLS